MNEREQHYLVSQQKFRNHVESRPKWRVRQGVVVMLKGVRWSAAKERLFGVGARQWSGLVVAQAITILSGIGIGTLLARALEVEGYGQYVFALTVVQLMMVPLDFGLPTLVMREVAILRARADWSLLSGLIRWGIILVTCVVTALVLGVLLWNFFSDTEGVLYIVAVLLAGIWAYLRLTTAVLRGLEQVVRAAMPDQVIRPLTMLLALALISLVGTLTPTGAMALHALATAVGLCCAVWILQRCRPVWPRPYVRAKYSPKAWFSSLMLLGMQVSGDFLNSRIDVLLLGMIADSRSVGLYGLGILIGGVARMPETIIKQMVTPRIARLYAKGEIEEIQRIARLSAAASVCAATVCAVGILNFGEPVVIILAGSEFAPAVDIAVIIASGSILTGFWCIAAPLLNMTGQEKHTARISWGSALVNAIANLILIPALGAIGAALATAIVTGGRQIAFAIIARQRVGISTGLGYPRILSRSNDEAS